MKIILLVFFAVFSVLTFSEPPKFNSFDTRKANLLHFVEEKISHFQEAKKCIENASDESSLNKCHSEMQQRNIEYRRGALDRRIRRLEEKRDSLQK